MGGAKMGVVGHKGVWLRSIWAGLEQRGGAKWVCLKKGVGKMGVVSDRGGAKKWRLFDKAGLGWVWVGL